MKEFFEIIFGVYSTAQLLGFVWFFIIGYIVYGLIEVNDRDVNSTNTPKKWYWYFWFYDNWRRYLLTILCTYILFKFSNELSGHEFGNFDALTYGLIGDGIAAIAKKKISLIGANREEFMLKMTEV